MTHDSENTELGLGPRLRAAAWFAVTACIPIVGFFGVIGRMFYIGPEAVMEPFVALGFVAIPILMAAFFGFVFGSRILNDAIVDSGANAVGHGMIVSILSYVGFVIAYGAGLILSAPKQIAEAMGSILAVAGLGALFVGWLVVLAGALGGWLLFRNAFFNPEAPVATLIDKRSAAQLNYWAAGVLLLLLIICWLPVRLQLQLEAAEDSKRDLFQAVWGNDVGRVRELLDSGLSVETKDVGGSPLLMSAAEKGHTRIVKLFLERGANPNVNTVNPGHWTALHSACSNFDVESIEGLVLKGANVNAVDDYGHTPLMIAVSTTDRDTVKFLIDHGANLNAVSQDGSTVLLVVRQNRDMAGNRDRMGTTSAGPDAGQNFGDSRDYQNPMTVRRARARHDAIIELLRSYGLN